MLLLRTLGEPRKRLRPPPWPVAVACLLGALGLGVPVSGCSSEPLPNLLVARLGVTLKGVTEGATVSGVVSVTAVVEGTTDLPPVTFFVGDTRVETLLAPPYTSTIDTRKYADGPTTLSAVAAANQQNLRTSLVKVTLDNTGPTVALAGAASSYWAGAPLAVPLSVSDPAGIASVVVKANGIPLPVSQAPYVATLDLSTLAMTLPADISLRIEATDSVFNQTVRTAPLRVSPRLAWRFDALGELWAPPAFGPDGTAYFGARDKKAYAVSPSGLLRWSTLLGGEIVNTPAFDPSTGRTWFSSGSSVAVLDATGKQVASWTSPTTVSAAPVIQGNLVHVGVFDGQLRALTRTTTAPSVAWSFVAGGAIESTPAVIADDVLVFGSDDRHVYAVDATGKELWKHETGGKVWGVAAARNGDVLVGSQDGYVYRLDRAGKKKWELRVLGQIWAAPSEAADGTLYVATVLGKLSAIDANGAKKWERSYPGFHMSSPAVSGGGTVYVADSDGVVHALGPDGAELWSYKTGGTVKGSARLSPDESMIVVGNDDRHMTALYTGESRCPLPEMALVNGVSVMKYEASRVDATVQAEGTRAEAACSRAGVKPWTRVTFAEAQAACKAVSLDLCAPAVWEAACRGAAQTDFPYGATYTPTACVGKDHAGGGCGAGGPCVAMATGVNAACVSASGIFDASGNVREWTLQSDGASRVVRGGGIRDAADELRCSSLTPARHAVAPDTRADDVGFRCCKP